MAAEQDVAIKTVDGKSTTGKFDTVFADGLSIVVGAHKIYFPLAGIMRIAVHPPKALLPEGTKPRSIASELAGLNNRRTYPQENVAPTRPTPSGGLPRPVASPSAAARPARRRNGHHGQPNSHPLSEQYGHAP